MPLRKKKTFSIYALPAGTWICWLYPLQKDKTQHRKVCPGYDIKLDLMVRLHFQGSR